MPLPGREPLRLADRNMRGSAGPEGVYGPREHTGPPCLREHLADGHLIEEVAAGVRYLLLVHEDRHVVRGAQVLAAPTASRSSGGRGVGGEGLRPPQRPCGRDLVGSPPGVGCAGNADRRFAAVITAAALAATSDRAVVRASRTLSLNCGADIPRNRWSMKRIHAAWLSAPTVTSTTPSLERAVTDSALICSRALDRVPYRSAKSAR